MARSTSADTKASWRSDEVSQGQRRYLYRLGLSIPKTKGEAADLITSAEMADQLERVEIALAQVSEAPEDEKRQYQHECNGRSPRGSGQVRERQHVKDRHRSRWQFDPQKEPVDIKFPSKQQQLSFTIGGEAAGQRVFGTVAVAGSLQVDRNLDLGDEVRVQVVNSEGEVIASQGAVVGAPNFKTSRDQHGEIIAIERLTRPRSSRGVDPP